MDDGDLRDAQLAKALWACVKMQRLSSPVIAHAYDWYLQNANYVSLEGAVSALRAF